MSGDPRQTPAVTAPRARVAVEGEEVAPLRRAPAPPPAPAVAGVERAPLVDDAASSAAGSRSGVRRPIARGDVYRHPVVAGRERRPSPWRALVATVRQWLTSAGEREEAMLDARLTRPGLVSRMNV